MSHYCEIETQFLDAKVLIEALIAVEGGFEREQILEFIEAESLYGYKGDKRTQKAHIIIRRKHVGASANDVGFFREDDGSYKAIISEFDGSLSGRFRNSFLDKIKQEYSCKVVEKDAIQRGLNAQRIPCKNGKICVRVNGYR